MKNIKKLLLATFLITSIFNFNSQATEKHLEDPQDNNNHNNFHFQGGSISLSPDGRYLFDGHNLYFWDGEHFIPNPQNPNSLNEDLTDPEDPE